MLDPAHVEVIIVCSDEGVAQVSEHLIAHGLEVLRTSQGVLAEGTATAVERAFGARVRDRPLPLQLPIPITLRHQIDSISVLGIPGAHDAPRE
jgi:hypothetical protein